MGRFPVSFEDDGLKKGPWTSEEDEKLIEFINKNGHGSWRSLPKLAGLNRCGKSCRLRWTNYLRPDIKRGKFSDEEERLIIHLHSVLGNKWSRIASHLPKRTDNEIKNFWNTHLRKRLLQMGIDPTTHRPRTDYNNLLMNLTQLLTTPNLVNQSALKLQADAAAQVAKAQLIQNLIQAINITKTQNSTQFGTASQQDFNNSSSYDDYTNKESLFSRQSETSLLHQMSDNEFQGVRNSWGASFKDCSKFDGESCGLSTNNNSLPPLVTVSMDCCTSANKSETSKDDDDHTLSSSYNMFNSFSPTGSSFPPWEDLFNDQSANNFYIKDFLEQ